MTLVIYLVIHHLFLGNPVTSCHLDTNSNASISSANVMLNDIMIYSAAINLLPIIVT